MVIMMMTKNDDDAHDVDKEEGGKRMFSALRPPNWTEFCWMWLGGAASTKCSYSSSYLYATFSTLVLSKFVVFVVVVIDFIIIITQITTGNKSKPKEG